MQATKGLLYLHSQNVIHRDFKPSNLLVHGDLKNITIKVADFDGLFLLKETISATVTSYHMKGMTLSYAAPEICANHIVKPTYASDIYSWAISAYEMLTNVSSPWANILPNLSDVLLFEALSKGQRPKLQDIEILYDMDVVQGISVFIEKAWSSLVDERPKLEQVCNENIL